MNLVEKIRAAGLPQLNVDKNLSDTAPVVEKVITAVESIAGVVAFFYLIYSGFLYLTAGGNPDQAKKAQQGIIYAVIGLAIVVLSYAIITAVIDVIN